MTNTLTRAHYDLGRVLAFANGKGGVGKTSLTTHVAALAARKGWRTLVVDMDPQGNVGEDLGYTARKRGDGGVGLARSIQYGDPPTVLRDIRPGLDVIPGGEALEELAGVLAVRRSRDGTTAMLSLAAALAPLADYDLIVLDCPPGIRELQEISLTAATDLVIPTKTDESSLLGLRKMGMRFTVAREINPTLRLLGVVLYGVTSAAKTARNEARAWVEEALEGLAPVFKATVRHVETPAWRVRKFGLLVHELETGPEAGVTATVAKTVKGLADDYEALTVEVMERLLMLEAAAGVAS